MRVSPLALGSCVFLFLLGGFRDGNKHPGFTSGCVWLCVGAFCLVVRTHTGHLSCEPAGGHASSSARTQDGFFWAHTKIPDVQLAWLASPQGSAHAAAVPAGDTKHPASLTTSVCFEPAAGGLSPCPRSAATPSPLLLPNCIQLQRC